jgi:hypothetical protein
MDLWQTVDNKFRQSDIKGAIKHLESLLAKQPADCFKQLVGAQFSNTARSILTEINRFIQACDEKLSIKAVYLEMNGFDINYHNWHFDFFGYIDYGADPDDIEWLCDWQSDYWPQFDLIGLETSQKQFESYQVNEKWRDKQNQEASEIANLLVMAKFVLMIQMSLQAGQLVKAIPVLATAHDFDIVGRFEP